jgi:AcrR family transcriptional regulator
MNSIYKLDSASSGSCCHSSCMRRIHRGMRIVTPLSDIELKVVHPLLLLKGIKLVARHQTPRPKQIRSEVSTLKLLDSAAALIGQVGYEKVTMAAIADHAGYSHGLITGRFGSKEGLLWSLLQRMVVDWRHEVILPELADLAGREALHHITTTLRRSWARHESAMRAVYVLMFEAPLSVEILRENTATLHHDTRKEIEGAISRAIDDETVSSSVNPAVVSRLFVGALRGAAYQHLLEPEAFPIDIGLRDIDVLVDRLLPPGPALSE